MKSGADQYIRRWHLERVGYPFCKPAVFNGIFGISFDEDVVLWNARMNEFFHQEISLPEIIAAKSCIAIAPGNNDLPDMAFFI